MSDTPTYVRGLIEALGQVQPEVENRTPDVNALVYSQQALARYATLIEQGDARILDLERSIGLSQEALIAVGNEFLLKIHRVTAAEAHIRELEAQVAAHEAVCAGTWVPVTEGNPEIAGNYLIRHANSKSATQLELMDYQRGKWLCAKIWEPTHWLDKRMPEPQS